MYAKYKYNNGATAANVLADVVAILTGTTDVQTLSASCDKGVSEITAAITPAGWVMHDSAASTNSVVLKAPHVDNASQFKFFRLDTNTSGILSLGMYESWNATTHAGTNGYMDNGIYAQRVNYTFATGGTLFISASVRHCLVQSLSSGANIGNSSTASAGGVVEYTRWDAWNTVSSGYTAYGMLHTNTNILTPRVKSNTGVDSTSYSLVMLVPGLQNMMVSMSGGRVINAAGELVIPLHPWFASGLQVGHGVVGGNISELADCWVLPQVTGTVGDETIAANGDVYVVFPNGGSSNRVAVRKG